MRSGLCGRQPYPAPEVPGKPKEGLPPIFCAYVRFLLLTGARRNEVAEMRWAELARG